MMRWLLGLELIDGWVLPATVIVTAMLLALVTAIRPRRTWRVLVGAVVCGAAGLGLVWIFDANRTFSADLPVQAAAWGIAGAAGAGAGIAALTSGPWWRVVLASLTIVASLVTGGLGVNRAFDITHTLSALLGVQAVDAVVLPARTAPSGAPEQELRETWTPPAGMPDHGEIGALSGALRIPSPGFAARDGAVYLPPAALVPDPPALPLIVFMMGQPGSPDPTALARTLDAFAAAHQGLAPIAIIADQLSSPVVDPACHDSARYGDVARYFTVEIPAFAAQHLNVIDDPAYRVIGGYSNGGSCALLWASQHPEVYGQVMDISGNEFPGSETVDATVQAVFGGDREAFEALKPAAVMAANAGRYTGHHAVFTSGSDDAVFGPGQQANAAAARAAGFTVTVSTVPGAGHVGDALDVGLADAVGALAVPLGLASG